MHTYSPLRARSARFYLAASVLLLALTGVTRAALLTDDFSDANWEARWETHDDGVAEPSNWVMGPAGGLPDGSFGNTVNTLNGPGPGGSDEQAGSYALTLKAGAGNWTDYSASCEMFHMDNDYAGLFVRYVDELNYIRVWSKQEEADVGGETTYSIDKQIDGAWTMFHKTGGPGVGGDGISGTAVPAGVDAIQQQDWFSMTAEVVGDTVTMYLNGDLVDSVQDADFAPGGALEKGSFALYNCTNPMAYDNVEVGSLSVEARGKVAVAWAGLKGSAR